MRGVILGPKTRADGTMAQPLTAIDGAVRRSILYWDKVRVPTSNIVHQESSPTMLELESCGLLERPVLEVFTRDHLSTAGDFCYQLQFADFFFAELKEPGSGAWRRKDRTSFYQKT